MLQLIPPILAEENLLDHVVDHGQIYWHASAIVTNHMIMMAIAAILMLLIFPWITSVYRTTDQVATGTRNLFETILIYMREEVFRPALGDETDHFTPFLWTLFFFILFNNLLGLLPISALTSFFWPKGMLPDGTERAPLGGTATTDIYVTGALALIAFFTMQASGIRANGLREYLKHFLGGAPAYMCVIMIPVEFLGMLVKPFALAVRLFANMNAGHILVAVLTSFVAAGIAAIGYTGGTALSLAVVAGTTAIMFLELFAAFLQAYIFSFLTCLFISMLVVHEHHHKEGEGGHHDEMHGALGGGDLTDGAEIPDATRQAGAHMAG
jgi:F-type H+-transporting ATPase subunit a